MATGTAFVILGIIYFCLISPGFRFACFCGVLSAGFIATLAILAQHH
jgi:hypothetical protein